MSDIALINSQYRALFEEVGEKEFKLLLTCLPDLKRKEIAKLSAIELIKIASERITLNIFKEHLQDIMRHFQNRASLAQTILSDINDRRFPKPVQEQHLDTSDVVSGQLPFTHMQD